MSAPDPDDRHEADVRTRIADAVRSRTSRGLRLRLTLAGAAVVLALGTWIARSTAEHHAQPGHHGTTPTGTSSSSTGRP